MKIKSNMASKLQRTGVISVVWHLGYLASQSSLRQEKNGINPFSGSIVRIMLYGGLHEAPASMEPSESKSETPRWMEEISHHLGSPRHCNYWDTYSSGHPLLLTVLKGADLATYYRSYYPWGSGLRYRMSLIQVSC